MGLSITQLKTICLHNIVEIKFTRRTKTVVPPTRRMLCTLCYPILNQRKSSNILNFRPPTNPPPYNAESKGLLTVWDIFMQDWRNVPVDACNIVKITEIIPYGYRSSFGAKGSMAIPEKKFMIFYNNFLKNMTPDQKKDFMLK